MPILGLSDDILNQPHILLIHPCEKVIRFILSAVIGRGRVVKFPSISQTGEVRVLFHHFQIFILLCIGYIFIKE